MAEILNLNRARKDRAKANARIAAAANRATHGRTRAEKALAQALAEKQSRALDQNKRETSDD